jgi:quercetin dioxygenase-like cupin family protein
MWTLSPNEVALANAWIEGEPSARWRSGRGHGPSTGARSSGSSVLEVPEGCRLPRHTDSAEETVVVVAGTAEVILDGDRARLGPGGVALIPADAPHEVRNAGSGSLRFVAVYASAEVLTRYADEVQPDGSHERSPIG